MSDEEKDRQLEDHKVQVVLSRHQHVPVVPNRREVPKAHFNLLSNPTFDIRSDVLNYLNSADKRLKDYCN